MSKEHTERVTCPKCGEKSDFVIWESINTMINPETKAKVLSGELFRFKCPKCGEEISMNYECLYHQMEDKFMVQLVYSDKSVENAVKVFDNFVNNVKIPKLQSAMSDYTFRIVRNHDQLREKIYIFNHGLDDRVIEIMKELVVNEVRKASSEIDVRVVPIITLDVADITPKKFIVRLYFFKDEKWIPADTQEIPYEQEIYDTIKADMTDDDVKRLYVVNYEWAYNYLANRNSN